MQRVLRGSADSDPCPDTLVFKLLAYCDGLGQTDLNHLSDVQRLVRTRVDHVLMMTRKVPIWTWCCQMQSSSCWCRNRTWLKASAGVCACASLESVCAEGHLPWQVWLAACSLVQIVHLPELWPNAWTLVPLKAKVSLHMMNGLNDLSAVKFGLHKTEWDSKNSKISKNKVNKANTVEGATGTS